MSILERILTDKRSEVAASRSVTPLRELEGRIAAAPAPRPFAAALRRGGAELSIIAEVKKASPSKGLIRADFDPVAIARAYRDGGASAISVLTDARYFQGRLEYLSAVRCAVDVPVLRKDFIVDRYQVIEARTAGADAILLILAAVPDDAELADLARSAAALGMEVLWEVHDRPELERLLSLPLAPRVIGVNNRDLETFEVDLATTKALLPSLPPDAVKVSESGFFERADLEMMREWGVDAFLIGESLMRAADPGAALARLVRSSEEAP